MTGRKLILAIVTLALLTVKADAQQTIQFSQYVFNGLAVNPAYAGYRNDWTVNLSSRILVGRDQWRATN